MPRALDVWLPLPVPAFRFLAPHARAADVVAGARVVVPWQGGVRIGVVAEVLEVGVAAALELREAIDVLDDEPWLLAPARRMLAAHASRYAVPVGLAVATLVPIGLDDDLQHDFRVVDGIEPETLGEGATAFQPAAWHSAVGVAAEALTTWREHGLIVERVRSVRPDERVLVAADAAEADAGEGETLAGAARANQRAALRYLERHGPFASAAELARAADVPVGAARALVAKGLARYLERPRALPAPGWQVPGELADAPAIALVDAESAIGDARSALVHGGRRDERLAILHAEVDAVVRARHQALVVVSEAWQVEPLAGFLAHSVPTLTLHADVDPDARRALWREVAAGTPLVLVGTYPALTAPLARLAQVHIWDAASTSYKLVAGSRGVARRDAEVLAEAAHAQRVSYDVIASAELRARRPEREIALPYAPQRVVASDLRSSATWPLSSDLIRVLKQVAARARQAVVIVPRRGFAAGLACRSCGTPIMCPHCDLPLRWHAKRERLRCHQCGHTRPAPAGCAHCGGGTLAPLPGAGTEWVAREVERIVAPLPVWVVDADHRSNLSALYDGASGVVVATTAALRLPPPPVLSLVAFTLGDTLYGHEDFRAEEQALRTLLQASELGGGRPLVLVQTFQSGHALWRTLAARDPSTAVAQFLEAVQARRVRFGYPPASHWARVQLSHRDRGRAHAAAAAAAARLRTAGVPDDAILGPVGTAVARLRGRYAVHLFVRAADDVTLAQWLSVIDRRPGDGVQVRLDVDPYDVHHHLE